MRTLNCVRCNHSSNTVVRWFTNNTRERFLTKFVGALCKDQNAYTHLQKAARISMLSMTSRTEHLNVLRHTVQQNCHCNIENKQYTQNFIQYKTQLYIVALRITLWLCEVYEKEQCIKHDYKVMWKLTCFANETSGSRRIKGMQQV